jgi:potassium-transporting ATPase KdpC subunit
VIRRQLVPAVVAFLVLTVLTGVAYPLAVTGVAQVAFPGRADGSLVERDGIVVGSRLIGQSFAAPQYFHPRPSAAGDGYDAMSSSASNLGPTNEDLLSAVQERVAAYRAENGLTPSDEVPVDAVTASGSGLDPHISKANALLQAQRVARERGIPLDEVLSLVDEHTDGRSLGFLGEPGVNVLELNLALDADRG